MFFGHEEEGTECGSAGVEASTQRGGEGFCLGFKEGAKNPKRKESLCGSRKGLFFGHEEEGTECGSAGVEASTQRGGEGFCLGFKEGAKNPNRKSSLCGSRKGLFFGHEEEETECCLAGVAVSTQRNAKLSGWEELEECWAESL